VRNSSQPWRTEGHPHVGMQARRFFVETDGASNGHITKWSPGDDEANPLDGALWHMVHLDGDEEDLELFEVDLAVRDFAEQTENGWITTGATFLNETGRVRLGPKSAKHFVNGRIMMYLDDGDDGTDDKWRLFPNAPGAEQEAGKVGTAEAAAAAAAAAGEVPNYIELDRDEVDDAVSCYNDFVEDGRREDEDENRLSATLWPTAAFRERWRAYVANARTDGVLSLALMCLVDRAIAFGVASVKGLPPATACERWRAATAAAKEAAE